MKKMGGDRTQLRKRITLSAILAFAGIGLIVFAIREWQLLPYRQAYRQYSKDFSQGAALHKDYKSNFRKSEMRVPVDLQGMVKKGTIYGYEAISALKNFDYETLVPSQGGKPMVFRYKDKFLAVAPVANKGEIGNLGQDLVYPNALRGIDIIYKAVGNSVKEDIVVKEETASRSIDYKYAANNLKAEAAGNNKVYFKDDAGNVVFSFVAPFITDKTGRIFTDRIKFSLNEQRSIITLTYDSKDMKYPVSIDPTIEADTCTLQNGDILNDASPGRAGADTRCEFKTVFVNQVGGAGGIVGNDGGPYQYENVIWCQQNPSQCNVPIIISGYHHFKNFYLQKGKVITRKGDSQGLVDGVPAGIFMAVDNKFVMSDSYSSAQITWSNFGAETVPAIDLRNAAGTFRGPGSPGGTDQAMPDYYNLCYYHAGYAASWNPNHALYGWMGSVGAGHANENTTAKNYEADFFLQPTGDQTYSPENGVNSVHEIPFSVWNSCGSHAGSPPRYNFVDRDAIENYLKGLAGKPYGDPGLGGDDAYTYHFSPTFDDKQTGYGLGSSYVRSRYYSNLADNPVESGEMYRENYYGGGYLGLVARDIEILDGTISVGDVDGGRNGSGGSIYLRALDDMTIKQNHETIGYSVLSTSSSLCSLRNYSFQQRYFCQSGTEDTDSQIEPKNDGDTGWLDTEAFNLSSPGRLSIYYSDTLTLGYINDSNQSIQRTWVGGDKFNVAVGAGVRSIPADAPSNSFDIYDFLSKNVFTIGQLDSDDGLTGTVLGTMETDKRSCPACENDGGNDDDPDDDGGGGGDGPPVIIPQPATGKIIGKSQDDLGNVRTARLADVPVTLYQGGVVKQTTRTNDNGEYRFTMLRAGTDYAVKVNYGCYKPGEALLTTPVFDPANISDFNDAVVDLNFPDIKVDAGYSISSALSGANALTVSANTISTNPAGNTSGRMVNWTAVNAAGDPVSFAIPGSGTFTVSGTVPNPVTLRSACLTQNSPRNDPTLITSSSTVVAAPVVELTTLPPDGTRVNLTRQFPSTPVQVNWHVEKVAYCELSDNRTPHLLDTSFNVTTDSFNDHADITVRGSTPIEQTDYTLILTLRCKKNVGDTTWITDTSTLQIKFCDSSTSLASPYACGIRGREVSAYLDREHKNESKIATSFLHRIFSSLLARAQS